MKKIIKKIHLYLGLVFSLFLILIGTTGAILSYEKEILELINPQVYNLDYKNKEKLDKKILFENLEKNHDFQIVAIRFYENPSKPIVLVTPAAEDSNSNRKVLLNVNPYTGELLPSIRGKMFFTYARYIHLDLLLGKVIGKNIVAISTIVLIILSISGLYLYAKPLIHNFKSAMKINFSSNGKRLYYKLHTVFGIYFLVAFLIMSLSGLFWSYDWFKKGVYSLANVEMPPSRVVSTNVTPKKRENNPLNMEQTLKALEIFENSINNNYHEFTIRKNRNSDTFKVSYLEKNYSHSKAFNTMDVNPIKNEIASHEKYEDLKIGEKVINSMLPIHSGEFFGSFFQIIFLIASLSLSMFAITGFLLYKKTRKNI